MSLTAEQVSALQANGVPAAQVAALLGAAPPPALAVPPPVAAVPSPLRASPAAPAPPSPAGAAPPSPAAAALSPVAEVFAAISTNGAPPSRVPMEHITSRGDLGHSHSLHAGKVERGHPTEAILSGSLHEGQVGPVCEVCSVAPL